MATNVMPRLSASAVWTGFPITAWDVTKSVMHKTTALESMTGREVRAVRWAYPHYQFKFVVNALRDQRSAMRNAAKTAPYNEFETLWAFAMQQYGMGLPFFFRDASDYRVSAQTIYASTPASVTDFQMVRTMNGRTEPVGGIDTGSTITVRIDGTPTTAYTANTPHDGWIRFTSAPGSGHAITADFSYYYKVRFLKDQLDLHTMLEDRWEAKVLEFRTVWR
jgi:uncharacterized protein (TIGR02217 family)